MRQYLPLALGVWLLTTLAQAAPATSRVILPNGLVVIAVEDRSTPIAVFHLAVRDAASTVPADRAGLAAMTAQLEQARLKAYVSDPGRQALAEELAARGNIAFNTETDYCEARGSVTEPNLGAALQAAGQLLFGGEPFTPQEVAAAKDLFAKALTNGGTNVVEATYYRFLRAMYGQASYLARPVTGTVASIAAISADDLNAYRAAYWGPNNASLVVIGPRTPQDLIATARQACGEFKPSAKAAGRVALVPVTESHVSVAALPRWHGVSVMVGVPVPGFGTKGFVTAQLLYALLEGARGRLEADPELAGNLGLNKLLGRNAESSVTVLPPPAQTNSFLVMHIVSMPQLMEVARAALLRHFLELTKQPPTPAELSAAVTRLLNSNAQSLLKRPDTAKTINCYELCGADYTAALHYEEQVRQIKATDLVTLAKENFQNHAIGVILPADEDEEH
jgi:predicted Zn-dependent peptidase